MLAATAISVKTDLCPSEVLERLEELIVRAELPNRADGLDAERVMAFMAHDKKFVTGQNRFVLLTDIGQWVEREGVPVELVREALRPLLG
jgi:3-dehydroquinate synthetase